MSELRLHMNNGRKVLNPGTDQLDLHAAQGYPPTPVSRSISIHPYTMTDIKMGWLAGHLDRQTVCLGIVMPCSETSCGCPHRQKQQMTSQMVALWLEVSGMAESASFSQGGALQYSV